MNETPHVDSAMNARRIELRLKWKDVIASAGISPQTLSKIRSTGVDGVDSLIIAKVEHALIWKPGSLHALTEGGDPTPLDVRDTEPPPASEGQSWILSDSRAQGIWDLDLPLAEREQMIRDLMEADLRRAREWEEREQTREAG
jgi:DNA-binding Xre family transcriptional regulator